MTDRSHPLSPWDTRELVLELAREPRTYAEARDVADLMVQRSTVGNLLDVALEGWERDVARDDQREERQWWYGVWSALLSVAGGAECRRIRRAGRPRREAA